MMFRKNGNTMVQQILAVGDEQGNLHILDIPRNLRRAVNNEETIMASYFDRELERVKYVLARNEIHNAEAEVKPTEEEKDVDEEATENAAAIELEKENAEFEASYRKLELEYRQKFNIFEKKSNEEGGADTTDIAISVE